MKIGNILTIALMCLAIASCGKDNGGNGTPQEPEPTPVPTPTPEPEPTPETPATSFTKNLSNPSATTQAQNVYSFLLEQNGKKIISGAMANVNNNNDFAKWVSAIGGKKPALAGYDFIHLPESKTGAWIDYSNIQPAMIQWNSNGLVAYMWHWRAPSSENDYHTANLDHYGYGTPSNSESPSEFDIREALKDGTWQHEFIISDIDKVAGYLKLLSDQNIPVIWRPLHEAAGSYQYGAWFWWGRFGDSYTKELWKLMYDRLVKHHGLNNLIWVWTAQYQKGYENQMIASYPGDEYVDIVGVDLYEKEKGSYKDAYSAALKMTNGKKMVALSETGLLPDPETCFEQDAHWSWFMLWYTYNIHTSSRTSDDFGNTATWLKNVMTNDKVITLDNMPSLK